jgi:glutamine amidotransferase PdxT
VLVQRGNMLAACFHPELQDDHPLIRRFVELVRSAARGVPGKATSSRAGG